MMNILNVIVKSWFSFTLTALWLMKTTSTTTFCKKEQYLMGVIAMNITNIA